MSNTGWIAFNDREPTESDFPILVADYGGKHAISYYTTPLEQWDVWQSFNLPETPKSRVFLRHYDGVEEEILDPVYVFPESGLTVEGDELFAGGQWFKAKINLPIWERDIGTIRRRIAN